MPCICLRGTMNQAHAKPSVHESAKKDLSRLRCCRSAQRYWCQLRNVLAAHGWPLFSCPPRFIYTLEPPRTVFLLLFYFAFSETGATCTSGPGVAAKVVVVAKTRVSDAPLGEPFRVLTKQCAEQVLFFTLLFTWRFVSQKRGIQHAGVPLLFFLPFARLGTACVSCAVKSDIVNTAHFGPTHFPALQGCSRASTSPPYRQLHRPQEAGEGFPTPFRRRLDG